MSLLPPLSPFQLIVASLVLIAPPQSPVSQFLLSEEDIQSSLNANQRRERLFGFSTRLTGLGEKMGMMNIASSFSNSYAAPDSPSPVARSRSVSPPPVTVIAPRRTQHQQVRYSSASHNGSPTKDGRRASADSFRTLDYASTQYDEATTVPGIVCPSPVKINIIPPQVVEVSPIADIDFRLAQCTSPSHRGNKRPSFMRANRRVVPEPINTADSGIDMMSMGQPSSWAPTQFAQSSLDQPEPANNIHGSRRKSHPPTLPSPVTTPTAVALRSSFDTDTTNGSTHFRAFPEPAVTWTRFKVSPYRFKSYLFLLIPLVFVFLHIYYLSVDRQFMRAGHAMVFGKPMTATTLWSSGDALLIDEHFDGFATTVDAQALTQDDASSAEWYDPDAKAFGDEYEAAQEPTLNQNGHKKLRSGQGRWLRRAIE